MGSVVQVKNNHWYEEGVNKIPPLLYKKYLNELYQLQEIGLNNHPFLDALSTSISYTPFSSEKVLHIQEEMKKGIQVSRMEIDISDICNFKCPGCTFQYSQQDEILSYDKLIAFILELKRFGIRAITLAGGGDPTQYNDNGVRLPTITETFKQYGIETFLVTNGYELSEQDIKRILLSVSGIRISYYNFIAPGEPSDKNETVQKNITKIIEIKEQLGVDIPIMIGYLISYHNLSDFHFAIQLAEKFGIIVTPRPLISIKKLADKKNDKEQIDEIITRTLRNYETVEHKINLNAPVAMREFLERVLAFNLPFEKKCSVTELGLSGKLRANGDLYRCGQLSTKPDELEELGQEDSTFYSNIITSPRSALLTHLKGYANLTSYGKCPQCREVINNIRINRFETLSEEVKLIREIILPAYENNKNLAKFW